jgi:hypothetical protein
MPELQIDGVTMAVIEQTLADDIKQLAAMHGVGRNHQPRRMQQAILLKMPEPQPELATLTLVLEFPHVIK